MASKGRKGINNSQVQNSVAERRLRPIYDWLDNGNNKKALQEADKVLKKNPEFVCCKALKALALVRLSREEEASPILNAIVDQGTTDEGALQALNIAFRETHQTHMLCVLYEKAVKLEPTNEELLSQLFMSYVRIGAYKKQQSAAMALYKLKAKTPYYFWAVMSVVLQAKTSEDEKMANSVILPLAERMVTKMEKEGRMDQEQETRLYLMVLEMQQKYKEALQVLEGPLGTSLESTTSFLDFIINSKLSYRKKLEHWDQVNVLAKEILQKNPDQWTVYLDYITSILRLVDQENSDLAENVDSSVGQAVSFITFQKDNNPKCRGPYLAQIELHSRLLARRDKDAKQSEMTDLLIAYFVKFGDKPCGGNDLKLYLPYLEATEAEKFFTDSLKAISFINEIPETIADVFRHVCWLSLERLVGKHQAMDLEGREEKAIQLIKVHRKCSEYFTDFSSTVVRPYDNYLVLASHILWELWLETGQDRHFWKAALSLSRALKESPASYNLRFILVKFLNQSGAVGASQHFHGGLELKHVQLDSLGYVLTRHIQTCAHFHTSIGMFNTTLKFFNTNYKDILDFIISAYRCGSFDKVIEFINLRQRLSSSQHNALLTVEQALIELLVEPSSHAQALRVVTVHQIDPEKDEIPWSDLIDNRDFKVMVSWETQERTVTDDLISESFLQDQKFLKYRSLILRSMAACLFLSEDKPSQTPSENGSCTSPFKVLASLLEQIEVHHSQVIQNETHHKALDSPIQGPDRSRLTLFVEGQHCPLFVQLLRFAMASHQGENPKEPMEKAYKLLDQMMSNLIAEGQKCHSMKDREAFLEKVVNSIESVNFFAIVCGVSQRLIEPNLPKKSKKKPQIQTQNQHLIALNETLDKAIGNLASFQDFFQKFDGDQSMEAELEALSLKEEDAELKTLVKESYLKTFTNIDNIVKSKIDYLKALKL